MKNATFLNPKEIAEFYSRYKKNVLAARKSLARRMTRAEKILFAHSSHYSAQKDHPMELQVDRVLMQDATAQMAILQFMQTGLSRVAVPTTIHCDHLIAASAGAVQDLLKAKHENDEVYRFLKSAANKYGIGFWNPGSGIIHQVFLEKYAYPASLVIGTDSHTPNMGGLSMVAIGVGGADAVEVMAGELWKLPRPKLLGIHLTGTLRGWASPKDIILKVCELLTVNGGTGYILEYFGEGARSLSATGKATITNMGAEIGATTSVFPYDAHTSRYLRATEREHVALIADFIPEYLQADPEVEKNPHSYFDNVIEIDLDSLKPLVVGPHSPDISRTVSPLGKESKKKTF